MAVKEWDGLELATSEVMLFGMGVTFVLGTLFMLWAFQERFPLTVVYHLFATILYFFLGQLFLMEYSETAATVPMHYMCYMFAIINFMLFILSGVQGFRAIFERRKYGEEEEW